MKLSQTFVFRIAEYFSNIAILNDEVCEICVVYGHQI